MRISHEEGFLKIEKYGKATYVPITEIVDVTSSSTVVTMTTASEVVKFYPKTLPQFASVQEISNFLVAVKAAKNEARTYDSGVSEEVIPVHVYPEADGEGGLVAGKIKIIPGTTYDNILMGSGAGVALASNNIGGNTFVGQDAGEEVTTGVENVFVGRAAGSRVLTASSNVIIGADADLSQNNLQKSIVLGTSARGTKSGQVVFGAETDINETVTRGAHINTRKTTAKDATVGLTAAEMLAGVITSASATAVALTTPTATAIMALLNGGAVGTSFELILDNTGGSASGAVTLTLDGSIVNQSGTAGDLIVAIGKVAKFDIYFKSATAAIIAKVW